MGLVCTIPAVADPVTLAEVKSHARVASDFTADDADLTFWIGVATDWVQRRVGRQLVTATYRQTWDMHHHHGMGRHGWGQLGGECMYGHRHRWLTEHHRHEFKIDRQPVQSISSVQYYDFADVQQTLDPANYWFDADSTPPRIVPKDIWPVINWRRPAALAVTFVAGYGDDGSTTPLVLKQAIRILAATWYNQRELWLGGNFIAKEIPMGVEALCSMYETAFYV